MSSHSSEDAAGRSADQPRGRGSNPSGGVTFSNEIKRLSASHRAGLRQAPFVFVIPHARDGHHRNLGLEFPRIAPTSPLGRRMRPVAVGLKGSLETRPVRAQTALSNSESRPLHPADRGLVWSSCISTFEKRATGDGYTHME